MLLVLLGQQELPVQLVQLVQQRQGQQQQVLVEQPMLWKCFLNRQWFRNCCKEQQLGKRQRFRHNRKQRLERHHTLVQVHCKTLQRPSIEQPSLLGALRAIHRRCSSLPLRRIPSSREDVREDRCVRRRSWSFRHNLPSRTNQNC